jgi:amino acid adenylation domain-containing protein
MTAILGKTKRMSSASPIQQGLWLLQHSKPDDSSYNRATQLAIRGPLNVSAFRQSLREIISRHESLRTVFVEEAGIIVPVVVLEFDEEQLGWSDVLDIKDSEEITRLAQNFQRTPFNLERGPLIRGLLLRSSPTQHTFVLVMHHIVMDGWSVSIIARELQVLYRAFSRGWPSPLAALRSQYSDYIEWLNSTLNQERLRKLREYWARQLDDAPDHLDFPRDARPNESSRHGSRLSLTLESELTQRLTVLSRNHHVSLFMILCAAYMMLLGRYTGRNDIAVGTPTAGRSRREFENLIGCFANLVVLRTSLSGSPTFLELIQRVRLTVLDALDHQDMPFSKLVEQFQPRRESLHTPFVSAVFSFNNFVTAPWELESLEVISQELVPVDVRFGLDVWLEKAGMDWLLKIEYRADMFDEDTVNGFAARYLRLLSDVTASPNQRIDDFSIFLIGDRVSVSGDRNEADLPQESTLHGLVEAQCVSSPDAIALECGDEALTYRELDSRARSVADCLLAENVQMGDAIAICVERSPALVVGLLGILKAGGTYVALEPTDPIERRNKLLTDSAADILLTSDVMRRQFDDFGGRTIDIGDATSRSVWRVSFPIVHPKSPAYILYTSGTTGEPKGVVVEHRNLVNLLKGMTPALEAHSSSKTWLAVTSIGFDISVLELFWGLSCGFKVVLMPCNLMAGIAQGAVSELIRKHSVSHFQCTPSLLGLLMETEDGLSSLKNVRKLLIGGEFFPEALARRLRSQYSNDLFNVYGPTETTVWSTMYSVDVVTDRLPIGMPISNTLTYVLDNELRLVPIGIPGELFIGGDGVAQGYLGNPGYTASRFLPDPFTDKAGSRMYRTGDCARYRRDGNIEFLGRRDQQLKIRGHRVELAEIETVLLQCPIVKNAAVVAVEERLSKNRIVSAFVIPALDTMASDTDEADLTLVFDWQVLWGQTYRESDSNDPSFDTAGWTVRESKQRIPDDEMHEWIETTVQRVLEFKPRRVLEIGCGTGMLLFRIAPFCERYVALDPSADAIEKLKTELLRMEITHVSLKTGYAHNPEVGEEKFDLIILNSVVQYFPDVAYLLKTLELGIEATCTGGRIFIGDVRNFDLLYAQHALGELNRLHEGVSRADLLFAIDCRLSEERELTLSPDFFRNLVGRINRVQHVITQVRRGIYVNEMTKFRYDAVLCLDKCHSNFNVEEVTWESAEYSDTEIARRFLSQLKKATKIQQVPNMRLVREAKLVTLLREGLLNSIGDLRNALPTKADAQPFDPWFLENIESCRVIVDWAPADPFSVDVLISPVNTNSDAATDLGPPANNFNLGAAGNQPRRRKEFMSAERQVRKYLQTNLPDYMIPSTLRIVPSLPLDSHGKVDRRSLLRLHRILGGVNYSLDSELARNPIEEVLVEIWKDVLCVDCVPVQADFFDLGGHSLLAIQILSRIRDRLRVEISLRTILETPTITAIAKKVSQSVARNDASSAPIPSIDRDTELPLSFQQKQGLLVELNDGMMTGGDNQSKIRASFSIKGELEPESARSAIDFIIQRHELLRTSFFPSASLGPVGIEGWKAIRQAVQNGKLARQAVAFSQTIHSYVPPIRIQWFNLEQFREPQLGAEIARIVSQDLHLNFDYAIAPLLRAMGFRINSNHHILVISMPHLVVDGWSLNILVKEWAAFYQAITEGELPSLPPLSIQYVDFAAWQKRKFEQLKSVLVQPPRGKCHALASSEVPFSTYRPGSIFGLSHITAHRISHPLDPALYRSMNVTARDHHVTYSMLLFAAFSCFLHLTSEKEQIGILTVQANRTRSEFEPLIGFFAGGQRLCISFTDDPPVGEILARTRSEFSDAAERREIVFLSDKPIEPPVESPRPGHLCSFEVLSEYSAFRVGHLSISQVAITPKTTVDAALKLVSIDRGVVHSTMAVEYCIDCFDSSTIASLLLSLERILREIIALPTQKTSSLISCVSPELRMNARNE